jgi:hypothetical protein
MWYIVAQSACLGWLLPLARSLALVAALLLAAEASGLWLPVPTKLAMQHRQRLADVFNVYAAAALLTWTLLRTELHGSRLTTAIVTAATLGVSALLRAIAALLTLPAARGADPQDRAAARCLAAHASPHASWVRTPRGMLLRRHAVDMSALARVCTEPSLPCALAVSELAAVRGAWRQLRSESMAKAASSGSCSEMVR